jgi:hypothetical protein
MSENNLTLKSIAPETYGVPTKEPSLGWHWLWYAPVAGFILAFIEWPLLRDEYTVLADLNRRVMWPVLFSPSAFAFATTVWLATISPLVGMAAIRDVTASQLKARQKWGYSALVVVGILLIPLAAGFFMWGTLPIFVDTDGAERIRFIPFIPLPWSVPFPWSAP